MTSQIVNGLHYHLPFYREVVSSREEADDLLDEFVASRQDVQSALIEPISNGYAVTINLEPHG